MNILQLIIIGKSLNKNNLRAGNKGGTPQRRWPDESEKIK
jgi:hypothetical protein